jgi:class 3 adenylate cyclase
MPLYMDIHRNSKGVTIDDIVSAHQEDLKAQTEHDVKYLRWWYTQDVGSIYCLVRAPNAEAADAVHAKAHGLRADEIIEVQADGVEDFLGAGGGRPVVSEMPADERPADTAFRTVVFTDLEGSTSMTQRLGDEQALALVLAHDQLMTDCLERHGGRRVKHTGDGLMASFTSVAKAIECMIDMQRALAEHNGQHPDSVLQARMGAAAGEPVSHLDDLFGATVQQAARLCDRAQPAQIIVSGVVRDLSIGKSFQFEALGDLDLPGFSEPVRAFGVRWSE